MSGPLAGSPTSPPRSRRTALLAAVLLLLVAALSWPPLGGPIDLRYDAGVYYVLGTSLANGSGYRLLNEPGAIEAVQYPPLLPALVALHQRVLGSDDPVLVGTALRGTFQLLFALLALLVFGFARRRLGEPAGFAVAALTVLSLQTWYLASLCFAELPFALLTLLFLEADRAQHPWSRGACAVLGGAAYLLRTSGIALLAAWVADAALARRWREAGLRALLAALPVLAWQAHVASVTSSEEYARPAYEYQRAPWLFYNVPYTENLALADPMRPELGELTASAAVARCAGNALRLPLALGESIGVPRASWEQLAAKLRALAGAAPGDDAWLWVAPLALGLATLAGLALLARRGERLLVLTVAGSAASMCVTPWPGQFTRYLMPLTPLLWLAALALALDVGRRIAARRTVWLAAVLAFLPIVVADAFAAYSAAAWSRPELPWLDRAGRTHRARYFYFDRDWQEFERAAEWLRTQTPLDGLVAATPAHYLHLRTGRPAILLPFEAQPERCLALLDGSGAEFVVVDSFEFLDVSQRYLAPALELPEARATWREFYRSESGRLRVFRRIAAGR